MNVYNKPEFTEILESDYPASIIYLLPYLLHSELGAGRAAADAIHSRLVARPMNHLPKLERRLRELSPYSGDWLYAWLKVPPSELSQLERFGEASVSLLGVASFHWNGYVREEAIKRLARVTTGAEMPFLILRLNDWVSNVRDAAYKAIRSRVKPEYCEPLFQNLFLLRRLEHAGRADHKEILQAVHDLLLTEQCRADLFQALQSADRFVRRGSFKLAFDLQDVDLKRIAKLALEDNDSVIRSWAAQTISSAFDDASLASFLDRMKYDRFMPVRRAALRMMIKLNLPDLDHELRKALVDSHASMREEARYHLKKIQPIDVAEFYRQQIEAKGPALYAAISGLGETGSAEDDRFVVPYTSHQSNKIRRAALKAIAVLRPNAHLDVFMNALEDEVPHLSRLALRVLAAKTSFLNVTRVWEVFRSTTHIHVKRNALSLIARFSKWENIAYLVQAGCETDEEIVVLSRRAIDNWLGGFNRSSSAPTPEQLARFKDALAACGESLTNDARQQLLFSLRAY